MRKADNLLKLSAFHYIIMENLMCMEGIIMKVITLCGSMKFQSDMMAIAQKMALEGKCILTPTYSVLKNIEHTPEQIAKLKEAHFKRIEMSDAILIVDINNYIGDSTRLEIDYAKKLGKELIYYSDLELLGKSE